MYSHQNCYKTAINNRISSYGGAGCGRFVAIIFIGAAYW